MYEMGYKEFSVFIEGICFTVKNILDRSQVAPNGLETFNCLNIFTKICDKILSAGFV